MEETIQNEQNEAIIEKVTVKDINKEKNKELVDKVMEVILKIK